ncbi:MAG: WD40 repeat domain-containing serine/threonine protein kinase, partial [Thermoanaerobaculia bacterium]
MDQARWNRIEALLQDALDLETDERLPFLRRACAGDEELLLELHGLLLNEAAGMFLETPAIASVAGHLPGLLLLEQRVSHYRIEAHVGAGGMGDVYRARDEVLQRTVALKALPPEFAADSARVRRFEQEAFAASRLNHPNILTIFEIVHSEEGHFIATEFVEGATLRDLMKDPATGSGRALTVERSLDIAIQIAAAINAAHTAWIIHRDIKPENIMVRSDGLVKVLDFGIAKLHDEPDLPSPGAASTYPPEGTVPGAVLGTANYMSPEQARGEPLDGRTDLYSLGLVLHEMLSGTRPAAGSPPNTERVPRSLQRIVRRLLQPKREDRYPSASELLDDLGRAKRRLESRTARRMVGLGALALVTALAVAAVAAALSVHETWDERVLRDGHTAAARQAIFSPDGRLLASCGEDGNVIIWDFAGRKRLVTLPRAAHKIAFSPDGRWLAAGETDGAISIWDTAEWRAARILREHKAEISALAFSGDGKLLASSSAYPDSTVILWGTDRWQKTHRWPGGVTHGTFLFLPGRLILATNGLGSVDLAGGKVTEGDGSVTVNWMAMTRAGDRLALIEPTGNVILYRLKGKSLSDREVIASRRAHDDHGRSAAFSPDGRLLATAAENIQIWDATSLRKIGRFDHPSAVWSVDFSPDGRWLVSAHGDGAILVWDLAEWRLEANLNEHGEAVRAVVFHPD